MKTIKEQYKEIVCGFNDERTDNVANRCTEIADDYAIEFALWVKNNTKMLTRIPNYTDTEVLQIFKKEKGL